jgi:choline dehydrogenase-like flavoprotein
MTRQASLSVRDPDVCVVGGGPAGLTIAMTLGAAGRRVVLLESGGFDSSAPAQELNDGDHGEAYVGLRRTRHRQIGGTANIWDVGLHGTTGAKYVPLSARDLADWPIGWDELEPYYVEAQTICGLGPLEYGATRWSAPARRPFELGGTGLTSGVYQFGYAGRFTLELVDELLGIDSVTVFTSATVVRLASDQGPDRLPEVRAVDGNGRTIDVRARAVVLACGAVENARLLLLSGIGDGRGSEWLGRCFMEHARDFSLVLVPYSRDLFAEAAFYDLFTSEDGFLIGGRLALIDDALDSFRLPNASMTLVPRARERRGKRLVALRRAMGMTPQGRYGWSRVRSPAKAYESFEIVLNLEQRPHPLNRIELSARRDRFGNPLPSLQLQWRDEEQERLDLLRELLKEWFRLAKLGRLLTTTGRRPNLSAHHHAGTTRMALDRQDGVVDPNGRVFGVDNLFLTGASVFPSAGFANPTLTIVALARRLGRHIDDLLP